MASLEIPPVVAAVRLEVETGADGHRRLVTLDRLATGSVIATLHGTLVTSPTRYSIQVGPDRHLSDLREIDAVNHSCEPSAVVDLTDPDRPLLRARVPIESGDEISIHYCATEYDMESCFECRCGTDGCFGTIRGFRHLSPGQHESLASLLGPPLPAWS